MKDLYFIVTKCLINIMLFIGVPFTICCPLVVKWYGQYDQGFADFRIYLSILFFICGIFGCLIIYELRKMMKTVEADDCFVDSNVVSLKKMGIYGFIISFIYCSKTFVYPTPGCFVVVIVFVVAGLFSRVLANVFARAIAYKQENDFTI